MLTFQIALAAAAIAAANPLHQSNEIGISIETASAAVSDASTIASEIIKSTGNTDGSVLSDKHAKGQTIFVWSVSSSTSVDDILAVTDATDGAAISRKNISVSDGKTASVAFGDERKYISEVQYSTGADGKPNRQEIWKTAFDGSEFRITPSKSVNGTAVVYEVKTTDLLGPNNGFETIQVGADTIQAKRQSVRSAEIAATVGPEERTAILMIGADNRSINVFVVDPSVTP